MNIKTKIMKTFKVVNILFPQITLFTGKNWECMDYIEKKFGYGFKAVMHSVIEIEE